MQNACYDMGIRRVAEYTGMLLEPTLLLARTTDWHVRNAALIAATILYLQPKCKYTTVPYGLLHLKMLLLQDGHQHLWQP